MALKDEPPSIRVFFKVNVLVNLAITFGALAESIVKVMCLKP